ncbi:hypothetical protein PDESU_00699 [Pontiella desulfatans]|uniref:4Fe-4S ferredoxin-type domain-containing protein n=1 Tax=Pontiella desulfatans TaxID=2750659 RepID=A0A6C2TWU4_PONDE|nr:Coenzyme F420 hydrogenase/dehydrogenase, beta subunit C-terminal domain [Pontiella desulfatans]VGO12148.1 hypothetical protein PDESU_00699 [Pontiella desulfatans]
MKKAMGSGMLAQIVKGGFCIGCGACASVIPSKISMEFDGYGLFKPVLPEQLDEEELLNVCPFADEGSNEDQLAELFFPKGKKDVHLGHYESIYTGHVTEGDYRSRGSSGGVVSWILAELLKQGLVDGVIHVKAGPSPTDRLFEYTISTSVEEVLAGAKSKYYPIEMSRVMDEIRTREGRFVFVGIPCFIKAARNLACLDPEINKRIRYYVGLVCGHLKSKAFADCVAWQAGIEPGKLESVDFRVKLPAGRVSEYGIKVCGDGVEKTAPVASYYGTDWGLGFFKYSACEYCDDVFAETADVAVGDAWLAKYMDDPLGNSVVISRTGDLDNLIQIALKETRLNFVECSVEDAVESQSGGLRHRRDGLSFRLAMKRDAGEWAPLKRVPVNCNAVGKHRRKIYALREDLRVRSHELWRDAVAQGDFNYFRKGMRNLLNRYSRLYVSFPRRLARKIKLLLLGEKG